MLISHMGDLFGQEGASHHDHAGAFSDDLFAGHVVDNTHTASDVHCGHGVEAPWVHFGSNDHQHELIGGLGHSHSANLDFGGAESHVPGLPVHDPVPWINFGPHAMHSDTDHDAVPDALDANVGHGALHLEPGALSSGVPWQQVTPSAMHHDADHDGVPDALDNHFGAGASDLPHGALSSGVPWQQVTPSAMHTDADGDGIPDALDNFVGPGAW